MDEHYDVIIYGTGLQECILSGLLSTAGKKVLVMDKNGYYGGESASLNLEQLYKKFLPETKEIPEQFGRSRNWNVDLCPKFIMACGKLVKMLLMTKVTRYLDFKSIAGSYVLRAGSSGYFSNTEAKVYKVPATASEAMGTSLMGMFQKRKFRNYLNYINGFEEEDRKTWQDFDPTTQTNAELFEKFGCDEDTQSFTGHAMALYKDDSYLQQPAKECMDRVALYAYSMSRYGNSPYIYPVYGLGGLPEGFSRLAAVHGGVFMLNRAIDSFSHEDGKIRIQSQSETATCDKLLIDAAYMAELQAEKVRKVGQVTRSICFLNHPIKNTNNADSCQIIIPGSQNPDHNSDLYVSCVSYAHEVAQQGYWVACASCDVETKDPHSELIPGLRLLGDIEAEFSWTADRYEPTDNGEADNVYVCSSLDSSSHFEAATREVAAVYERMTGTALNWEVSTEPEDLKEM